MLLVRAFAGLVFLLTVMAAVVFVPAGTTDYWQASLFLAVFGFCVLAITVYLALNDRALLERRLHGGPTGEREHGQQLIQTAARVVFLGLLIVPGFDHRFGWSTLPVPVVVGGDTLVVMGLAAVFRTFQENTFTSAVIAVGAGQQVVTTGPYSHVRHPMYAGALLMLAGVPLALGSLWGLIAFPPMLGLIVLRLLAEERFLSANLDGYAAYRARVKCRLVPGVW
jgi:protein-S-isoprenylcysteine O-methyltransferase Ste14